MTDNRWSLEFTYVPQFFVRDVQNWLWAELMQRRFWLRRPHVPALRGRLELIVLIEDPKVIRRILSHLGLPTDVPAARSARPPPLPIGRSDPWYDEDVSVP